MSATAQAMSMETGLYLVNTATYNIKHKLKNLALTDREIQD